jgi:AraC-like DNA-binding protein
MRLTRASSAVDKDDMSEHVHYRSLFQASTAEITDVRCRPTGCDCGPEEFIRATSIAIPRTGVFVKHIGRERIVATSNHALFFNAGEAYRVSHPVPGGDDCTCFAFDTAVLASAVGRFDPAVRERPGAGIGLTHGPLAPRLAFLLQSLRRSLRHYHETPLCTEELAIGVLDSVLESAFRIRGERPVRGTRTAASAQRERVEAAKAFVAARFRKSVSLAEVAASVHFSPYHLARLFRREAGVPIHQFQNRLRLGAALEQLADDAGDLTALALDVGYSSHSHFSDAFRRAFGVPPSDFRRALKPARVRELSKILKAGSPSQA